MSEGTARRVLPRPESQNDYIILLLHPSQDISRSNLKKKIAVKMGGTIPKMTCIPSWFRFIYSRYVLQFFASNKKVSKRFHKYHLAVFVLSLFVRTHIVLAFTPFWILPTRVTRCGVWPFMNHSCRIQAWCPLQASEHLKHLFGTKSNWSILIY